MINVVREILLDVDVLINKIESAGKDTKCDSIVASWNPYLKWPCTDSLDDAVAFSLLLFQWIETQKKYFVQIRPGNDAKTPKTLLVELFGTTDFSFLEIEEIAEKSIYHSLKEPLVRYVHDEKQRLAEMNSINKANGLAIKCMTGDILYFGKTKLFYFLLSHEYTKKTIFPIKNNIHEILFANKEWESIRKRPGMYIGSVSKRGLYILVSELIEDILKNAGDKVISLELLPENILEIICESYTVKNNTYYINYLAVASALGEFFGYQDEQERVRTENGIIALSDHEAVVSKGTKIIWKPDSTIFGDIYLDYNIILARMLELAQLNPYIITISDAHNRNILDLPKGVVHLLERDCFSHCSSEILTFEFANEEFTGKAAISFSAAGSEVAKSYVNSHLTHDGGTHVEGMLAGSRKALRRILNTYGNGLAPKMFMNKLNYVIHIQMDNPRYYGATKRKLQNLEVKLMIQKQVEEEMYSFLQQDSKMLKSIYPNCFIGQVK